MILPLEGDDVSGGKARRAALVTLARYDRNGDASAIASPFGVLDANAILDADALRRSGRIRAMPKITFSFATIASRRVGLQRSSS